LFLRITPIIDIKSNQIKKLIKKEFI